MSNDFMMNAIQSIQWDSNFKPNPYDDSMIKSIVKMIIEDIALIAFSQKIPPDALNQSKPLFDQVCISFGPSALNRIKECKITEEEAKVASRIFKKLSAQNDLLKMDIDKLKTFALLAALAEVDEIE